MEWYSVRVPEDVRVHLLRHFERPSEAMLEEVAATHGDAAIRRERRLPGSRFFSAFADSPEALLARLKEAGTEITEGLNGNLQVHAVFGRDRFPQGIGTVSVVALEQLPKSDRINILKGGDRGPELLHLWVSQLPVTYEATVILSVTPEGPVLVTAFPGPPAPPLPDPRMDTEQFKACKAFWDQHVFLICI